MLNKAILMGRLTADPELRKTSADISVTSFCLAVDRNYGKGDAKQCDFINCVAWRQEAEFISRYFSKGKLMAVEGSIQTRKYVDKDNNNRVSVEVLVTQAYFGESKGSSSSSSGSSDDSQQFGDPPPVKDSFSHSESGRSSANPVSYSAGSADDFAEIEGEEDLPF